MNIKQLSKETKLSEKVVTDISNNMYKFPKIKYKNTFLFKKRKLKVFCVKYKDIDAKTIDKALLRKFVRNFLKINM